MVWSVWNGVGDSSVPPKWSSVHGGFPGREQESAVVVSDDSDPGASRMAGCNSHSSHVDVQIRPLGPLNLISEL